jgi:hypothetical protein
VATLVVPIRTSTVIPRFSDKKSLRYVFTIPHGTQPGAPCSRLKTTVGVDRRDQNVFQCTRASNSSFARRIGSSSDTDDCFDRLPFSLLLLSGAISIDSKVSSLGFCRRCSRTACSIPPRSGSCTVNNTNTAHMRAGILTTKKGSLQPKVGPKKPATP